MSDDNYSVRINRQEGVVEITGPDKGWIADQLAALRIVYEAPPSGGNASAQKGSDGAADKTPDPGDEAKSRQSRRRASTRAARNGNSIESQLGPLFTREVAERFKTYCDERHEKNRKKQPDVAAIIATFALDELATDGISSDDLIAVHRAMGWQPPKNPSGVLGNATTRNGYFSGVREGKSHLTPTGEHFGRHTSKEAPPK